MNTERVNHVKQPHFCGEALINQGTENLILTIIREVVIIPLLFKTAAQAQKGKPVSMGLYQKRLLDLEATDPRSDIFH